MFRIFILPLMMLIVSSSNILQASNPEEFEGIPVAAKQYQLPEENELYNSLQTVIFEEESYKYEGPNGEVYTGPVITDGAELRTFCQLHQNQTFSEPQIGEIVRGGFVQFFDIKTQPLDQIYKRTVRLILEKKIIAKIKGCSQAEAE